METEKNFRKYEELRTVEDYANEFANISEIASNFSGANEDVIKCFDEILLTLTKGLNKKYKYINSISKKWSRKQGLLSRFRDYLAEKQENKLLKKQLENERIQAKIKELMGQSKRPTEDEDDCKQDISSQSSGAEVLSEVKHNSTEVITEGKEPAVLDF